MRERGHRRLGLGGFMVVKIAALGAFSVCPITYNHVLAPDYRYHTLSGQVRSLGKQSPYAGVCSDALVPLVCWAWLWASQSQAPLLIDLEKCNRVHSESITSRSLYWPPAEPQHARLAVSRGRAETTPPHKSRASPGIEMSKH